MSAPDIPTNYTVTSAVTIDSLDAGLDNIRIKEIGPVGLTSTSTLTSTNTLNSTSTVTSDSKVDLGLDNIQIKELPKIDLQLAMKPTRVHFPVNLRFGMSSLGMELLTFSVCGESMVVIEDYVPHKTEICR
jgi:hypothetical protein